MAIKILLLNLLHDNIKPFVSLIQGFSLGLPSRYFVNTGNFSREFPHGEKFYIKNKTIHFSKNRQVYSFVKEAIFMHAFMF